MVGFVIVSHSRTLADGVVELTSMMADGVPIRAAGGLDDGSFGTSYEKIANAIDEIYSDDGVIVLMDMGSAVMTAEMVLESMPERKLSWPTARWSRARSPRPSAPSRAARWRRFWTSCRMSGS